jgi:archaeosortase A
MKAWNMISLNGYTVEIILACTAIESIALFMGLIGAVRAPLNRLAMAFVVSVPVIYILNLIRDIFVVVAYGEQWFGADSFIIAHNYIAKAGSGIALFVISYAVLRILPELFGMIDGLWVILSIELKSLLRRSEGD